MKIVGLDLSLSRTGIATTSGACRTVTSRYGPDNPYERLFDIVRGIAPLIAGADLAVIEGYQTNARRPDKHGNSRPSSELTGIRLGELGGAVRFLLTMRKIAIVEVHPSTLKSWAGRVNGRRHDSKDDSISAALTLGYQPAPGNHDEADAALLHAIGRHRYDPDPRCPDFTDTLAALPWPDPTGSDL